MMPKRNRFRFTGRSVLACVLGAAVSVSPVMAADLSGAVSSDVVFEDAVAATHAFHLFIRGTNGQVVLDEGTGAERILRVDETTDGKRYVSVLDAEGTLLSQTELQDGEAVYSSDMEAGMTTTVKAVADDGYAVSDYVISVSTETIQGEEETGFEAEKYADYSYGVVMDADKSVTVDFKETADNGIILQEGNAPGFIYEDADASEDYQEEIGGEAEISSDIIVEEEADAPVLEDALAGLGSENIITEDVVEPEEGEVINAEEIETEASEDAGEEISAEEEIAPIANDGLMEISADTEAADGDIFGGIRIQKKDREFGEAGAFGDSTLEGVTYAIINASDVPVEVNGRTVKSVSEFGLSEISYAQLFAMCYDCKPGTENTVNYKKANSPLVQEIRGDANGLAQTGLTLPAGTYYVIEIVPPYLYLLDTNWVGSAQITEDAAMVEPVTVQELM